MNVARHTKVPNLHHKVIPDQTVSRCQVSVNKLHLDQILHASSDLGRDLEKVFVGKVDW